jgi:cytochrome c oxidase subunit 2
VSATPLGYLTASGPRAATILPLTWFTLIVSILVCLIVAALLALSIWRRRENSETAATVMAGAGSSELRWITWGLAISAVPLTITLVWTMAALARVAGPPRESPLTIDVTGHQWWWEVDYPADGVTATFAAANEIHIPIGVNVVVRLHGADVIHSFWVPGLSGKTDAIPGQTNLAWLEADQPGTYHGTCAEYCGLEHAKMAFDVIAEPPAIFARWRTAQATNATMPLPGTDQARGAVVFAAQCGQCHTIRGAVARSRFGPDLTHLMSRRMIASGVLPNDRGARAGWIENAQASKPGALMPDQHLSARQLNDVDAYMETLR